ncbi:MAG TPA: hypothetical protein PK566_15610 [Pseudobacteroides sp.]|nr:hypothetical protein [Pseudobacteroides sp.]HOV27771.1 hypothetical protein [Pseudobacteroides sp.]
MLQLAPLIPTDVFIMILWFAWAYSAIVPVFLLNTGPKFEIWSCGWASGPSSR